MTDDLRLNFTGKAVLIIELENAGPMEFRFNDMNVLHKLVNILLDETTDEEMSLTAYDKDTEANLQKLLDTIE